jgi:hypothetical protein
MTLVLRRSFSQPFIINLLACHRRPHVPRTDGAKVERGEEPHNRFPNISRKKPCFWEKMALFWENQIVLKKFGQSCGRKLLLWPKKRSIFLRGWEETSLFWERIW